MGREITVPLLDTSSLAILAQACSMLRSARTISSGRRRRWPKENSHRCRFRRTITTTYARGSDWRQRWSTACERTIFFTTAIPTESISSFIALSLAKGFSWRLFSEAAAILATAHRTQFSALPLSGVWLGQTFRHKSLYRGPGMSSPCRTNRLLLAQNGHHNCADECPLSGVGQT